MAGLSDQSGRDPYELLFEHAPVAIWLEDFSPVRDYLMKSAPDVELPTLLQDRAVVVECIRRVRILHVNRYARDFYGATTSQELTCHFEDLFDDATIAVFREELIAFAEGKQSFQADIFARTLRGDARLVKMNCALVADRGEAWSFVVVTFTDLDERRVFEQHLRASERRAQEYARTLALRNQDLENFAYAAAHDLREPLRTVSLYAQLLRQRDNRPERTEAAVQFILNSTHKMQQLITDLLAFAQSAGAPPAEDADPVSEPDQVAHDVVLSLGAAIQEAHARIQVHPMPPVAVETGHLQQLLQNLLSNAIKYRHHDRTLQVEVFATRSAGRTQLTVADNGSGIRAEYHERIFGIFHRLHGPEIQGSGIGLALCARIADMYNGRIWVESDGVSGSAFHIDLPSASGHDQSAAEA